MCLPASPLTFSCVQLVDTLIPPGRIPDAASPPVKPWELLLLSVLSALSPLDCLCGDDAPEPTRPLLKLVILATMTRPALTKGVMQGRQAQNISKEGSIRDQLAVAVETGWGVSEVAANFVLIHWKTHK